MRLNNAVPLVSWYCGAASLGFGILQGSDGEADWGSAVKISFRISKWDDAMPLMWTSSLHRLLTECEISFLVSGLFALGSS